MATWTPGTTALLESETVPEMNPRISWASAHCVAQNIVAPKNNASLRVTLARIRCPPNTSQATFARPVFYVKLEVRVNGLFSQV